MTISPMLAHDYGKYDITYPVYSQAKIDGLRCIATRHGCFSRNGNRWPTIPHIEEALRPAFDKLPDLVLDGEIYNHDLCDNFPEICSIVKRTKITDEVLAKSKTAAQYWVFDVYSSYAPYCERKDQLMSLPLNYTYKSPLRFLDAICVWDATGLDSCYDMLLTNRYEGQMIRADKPYVNKRTPFLLKRKPTDTEIVRVVNVIEGEGKWLGMAGAFDVKLMNGQRTYAALKDTDEMRRKYWLERDKLIGRDAQVLFQKKLPSGIPRHPRLKAIL